MKDQIRRANRPVNPNANTPPPLPPPRRPTACKGSARLGVLLGVGFLATAGLLGLGLWHKATRAPLSLSGQLHPGWLLTHDLDLANSSGQSLSNVRVRLEFVGETGNFAVERYWPTWPLGEHREISLPVAALPTPYWVAVSGHCDQGTLDQKIGR